MREARNWNHPKVFAAFAYHGSPLYSIAGAALILAIALHAGPLATIAAKILSSKPIKHLEMVRKNFSSNFQNFLISQIGCHFTVHRPPQDTTFSNDISLSSLLKGNL